LRKNLPAPSRIIMMSELATTGSPYFIMARAELKEADKETSADTRPHATRHPPRSPSTLARNTPLNPSLRPATSQMLKAAIVTRRNVDTAEKAPGLLRARRCVRRTPCKVSKEMRGSKSHPRPLVSPCSIRDD